MREQSGQGRKRAVPRAHAGASQHSAGGNEQLRFGRADTDRDAQKLENGPDKVPGPCEVNSGGRQADHPGDLPPHEVGEAVDDVEQQVGSAARYVDEHARPAVADLRLHRQRQRFGVSY